jgi:hypothetical protein
MKEAFNLVIQMGDPRVQPYLDAPRFIQSQVFKDALRFAIEHYKAHGDRGHMVKLWQLYSGPAARRKLNDRFFAQVGVQCSIVQGQIHFDAAPRPTAGVAIRPAPSAQATVMKRAARVSQAEALMSNGGAKASLRAPSVKKSAAPVAQVKKKKKKPKKVDLLDSWAMVSGSYGSGRRR